MAAYTAKFNAQEGKSLARDEFRFSEQRRHGRRR